MTQPTDIEQRLKAYILEEFLAGEDPSQVTDASPLVTSGVLDSIATLRFVSYLEQEFAISIDAHEVGAENFETIASIAKLIRSKQGA